MIELPRSRDNCLQPLRLSVGYPVAGALVVVDETFGPCVPYRPSLLDHWCQMILKRAFLVLSAPVEYETTNRNRGVRHPPAMFEIPKIPEVLGIPVTKSRQRRGDAFAVCVEQECYRVFGHVECAGWLVRNRDVQNLQQVQDGIALVFAEGATP